MGGGVSKYRQKSSALSNDGENMVQSEDRPAIIDATMKQPSHEEIPRISSRNPEFKPVIHNLAAIETENSSVTQDYVNHRISRDIIDIGEHIDEKDSEAAEDEEDFAIKSAEMFHNTAMSLEMNNEELLFNLMYFGGESSSSFDNMVNNALEETVALHSDNNTPYKLKPASANDISYLKICKLDFELLDDECSICRDNILINDSYIQLENCCHYFHDQCLMKWLTLQDWCPACREPIHANKSSVPRHQSYGHHRIETIDESFEGIQEDGNRNDGPVADLAQMFVQASMNEAMRRRGTE